jgi:hypothetical protein
MWEDPIVEEVRKRRQEYMEEHGWDMEAIRRDLKEFGRTLPNPRLTPVPPRLPSENTNAA